MKMIADRVNKGKESYGSKENGKEFSIPKGNAQLVYGIDGEAGEEFEVTRNGTMLPLGKYKVIRTEDSRTTPFGSFSQLVVEKV